MHLNTSDLAYTDPALFSITKNLVTKLRRTTSYYDAVAPYFSKVPLAQCYFVEQFVDYDFLIKHYHKAIRAYLSVKKSKEAKIFGLCLLYLKAYLECNRAKCFELISEINKYKIDTSIHPFVIGRYFVSNLLHQHFITEKNSIKWVDEILEIEKYIPRTGIDYVNFPGFHFVVCDALCQAGYYNEVILLSGKALKEYPNGKQNVDTGFYTALHLFRAISFYHLEDQKSYKKEMSLVKTNKFNFLSEKYFTIQLNQFSIKNKLLTKSNEKQMKLSTQYLIEQTGFVRFSIPISPY